jgi:perosamine synthetase
MKYRQIAIALPSTGDDEWHAVREPLTSGWLTQGPKVAAFEKAFAARHKTQHALAVTSCTTGLHLMLAAAGIGPGDEVIVPAFTWVATANVVLYCGATPVFADVSTVTNNIDIDDMKRRVTSRTKAVIAVHLFGLCTDIPAIRRALPPGVLVLEDCACAAGAEFDGVPAGALGNAGAFSFHPRKSITTGEGGMVTTNDSAFAEVADQLRNHGACVSEEQRHRGSRPYLLPDFNLLGYNYRMTDLQGAVGLVQLGKLDRFIDERNEMALYYRDELASVRWLRMPEFPTNGRHAWQAFVTFVDPQQAPLPRNDIMQRLQEKGVSTRPGTHAVHMLGYYRDRFNLKEGDFPGARDCNNHTMAIPLHNRMNKEDCAYVVSAIKSVAA